MLRTRLPRPFLKWAGGKRQLLGELIGEIDRLESFGLYHEPFLGGGALFFELSRLERLPAGACLSDTNLSVIDTYIGVQTDVAGVMTHLGRHASSHTEEYYYRVRSQNPVDVVERAARVIYLNKTCFNGLYRENRAGQFNVPIGRYINPPILDEANLSAVSNSLHNVPIRCASFESCLVDTFPGDLVYFDPPYHPVSQTSSFTSYSKDGFSAKDQRTLRDVFAELDRRSVHVMLSNSATAFVRSLYDGFRQREVLATRAVNSKGAGRGRIPELLITNF